MPLKRCQMNIRAAEAMVSNAPNPMKIFPIREVRSKAVLSPVVVVASAGGELVAAAGVELPSCSVRSVSLSWSAATMKVPLSVPALAWLSEAWAGALLPAGMAAAALICALASSICALAFAIDGGMFGKTLLLSAVASVAILSASDFIAIAGIPWFA